MEWEEKNRKYDLIDATMRVVAENGLLAFSMKKVTNLAGVSEALIYKHFETKEKLLYLCFETVHRQIAALFDKMEIPPLQAPQEIYEAVRAMWMTYFSFLVQNSYRTIYYFEYRDSRYIRQIMEADQQVKDTYFQGFVKVFMAFNAQFHIYDKTSPDHLWTYILDVTGIFAKRVIRGELPDTEESRENIWELISGGLFGLLQ